MVLELWLNRNVLPTLSRCQRFKFINENGAVVNMTADVFFSFFFSFLLFSVFVDADSNASGQCNSHEITGRKFYWQCGLVNFGWRLFIFVRAKKFSLNIHISERARSVSVLCSSNWSTLTRSITKKRKDDVFTRVLSSVRIFRTILIVG